MKMKAAALAADSSFTGELWEAFRDKLPFSCCFYDSVVYKWWKTPQVLKSVHYFVIIPFLCLGGWSRVDVSAGLNLSQSLFCWFLGECCLIIAGVGGWKGWWGVQSSNPRSETHGQSGISLPLENRTDVLNNELKASLPPPRLDHPTVL